MRNWGRQRKSFVKKKCKGILTISYQLCGYNKAQQAVHQQHRKFHVFMVRHWNRMQRAE